MSLSCIIISRALLVHWSLLRVVSVFSGLVWIPSIICCLNVLCVILCRESQRTVLLSASWRGSAICFTDISYAAWKRTRKTFFHECHYTKWVSVILLSNNGFNSGTESCSPLQAKWESRENIWSLVKRSHLVTCQKWKWLSLHSRKLIYSSLMMLNKLYGVCMI